MQEVEFARRTELHAARDAGAEAAGRREAHGAEVEPVGRGRDVAHVVVEGKGLGCGERAEYGEAGGESFVLAPNALTVSWWMDHAVATPW